MARHCKYCGRCTYCHECVTRKKRSWKRKTPVLRKQRAQKRQKTRNRWSRRRPRRLRRNINRIDAGTQITSPQALSPLYVSATHPQPQTSEEQEEQGEITPQMILESLRELSMWREFINFNAILNHIKLHYPVRRHRKQAEELYRKLWIAQTAGIVCVDSFNRWRLQSTMEKLRRVPENIVSLFWRLYCDTMCALDRRLQFRQPRYINKPKTDSDSDSLPSVEGSRCGII